MAAIFATTNDWHCLPDDKALWRRFIVVECGTATGWQKVSYEHIRNWIKTNLDQLWAEALHHARQDGIPYLPESLKQARDAIASQHSFANSVVDDVVQVELDDIEGLELRWILDALGVVGPNETHFNAKAAKDVRGSLIREGFKNQRVRYDDGRQHSVWIRPGFVMPPHYNPQNCQDAMNRLAHWRDTQAGKTQATREVIVSPNGRTAYEKALEAQREADRLDRDLSAANMHEEEVPF